MDRLVNALEEGRDEFTASYGEEAFEGAWSLLQEHLLMTDPAGVREENSRLGTYRYEGEVWDILTTLQRTCPQTTEAVLDVVHDVLSRCSEVFRLGGHSYRLDRRQEHAKVAKAVFAVLARGRATA